MDLADNPGLRAELEAARSWGVSWRRFSGWEPSTTTTYEYDAAGHLVRSVTTAEPEWDDAERDAAFALIAYEAGLCPGCRRPLAETTKPEHEYRYRAGQAVRCHACTASEQAQERYRDSPQPSALLIRVELRLPDAAPAEEG